MSFNAKILTDSVSLWGHRLITMEVTYPRVIHAEMLRHRMFGRCVASSRAIPVKRILEMVQEDPYIPSHWGRNQRGMQAEEEVSPQVAALAKTQWLKARDEAVASAQILVDLELHKQVVNRLLEPWVWVTEVITATDWDNFFHLRCHPDANPEIRIIAEWMRSLYEASTPQTLEYGMWHTPYIDEAQDGDRIAVNPHYRCKVSVGRCARLSYLTHEGVRDLEEDVKLHDRLVQNGHMSPTEHVARPMTPEERETFQMFRVGLSNKSTFISRHPRIEGEVVDCYKVVSCTPTYYLGNLNGWFPYRKTLYQEWDALG